MRFDVAVYDPADRLVAVFEAKAQRGVSTEWATQFRRNLMAHFGAPESEFFGVVTPTTLFLWRRRLDGSSDRPPDFEIDLSEHFGELPERAVRGQAFEFVVSSWLSALTSGETSDWPDLERTGLTDAIRNGRMAIEAAA